MNKLLKLILYFISGISLPILLSTELQNVVADIIEYRIYLPMISKSDVIPTPSLTQTPLPTQPPIVISGNIQITTIFFNGVVSSYEPDEYVEIKNFDTRSIQVEGWTLRDIAEHVYTFPNFVMSPNQTCRIYTNQKHPEFCSFNYGSGQAIWNNTGDTAYLKDSAGHLIDEYSY
jgi:hypothetical protein